MSHTTTANGDGTARQTTTADYGVDTAGSLCDLDRVTLTFENTRLGGATDSVTGRVIGITDASIAIGTVDSDVTYRLSPPESPDEIEVFGTDDDGKLGENPEVACVY